MAELQVKTQDNLKNCDESFEERSNYQKTIRFANSKLKDYLTDTVKYITERNEKTRLEDTYNSAVEQMKQATSEFYFNSALELFESISGYKDADILAKECREKAEIARKEGIYKRACEVLNDNHTWIGKDKSLEEAIAQFRSLNGWKDADEKIKICQEKIEEIKLIKLKEEADLLEAERKAEEEKRIADENAKRKAKNIIVIVVAILCVCIAFAIVLNVVIIPK